jgi:hypothetical protein
MVFSWAGCHKEELAFMPSMVWGRRKRERELRERNGGQLVGGGDIYNGQLLLRVVENRPRRCPIFFPPSGRLLLSITVFFSKQNVISIGRRTGNCKISLGLSSAIRSRFVILIEVCIV